MGFSDFGYVTILSHDGGPYDIEISPLIFRANQWTDFYILGISVMKELKRFFTFVHLWLGNAPEYR